MHIRSWNRHEIGDPLIGCRDNVFEWRVGGGDMYVLTLKICIRGEGTSRVQTEEKNVQTIIEDVVPSHPLVLNQ